MREVDKNKTVGERVKNYRESLGLSQGKLAKLVQEISGKKCTQQTIGNIESDSVKNSHALPYVAIALGVSLKSLNPDLDDNMSLVVARDVGYNPLPHNRRPTNNAKTLQTNPTSIQTSPFSSLLPLVNELNPDIPVFGTIDLTDDGFIITDTPIDFIPRPSVVKLEKDAFAISIGVRTLEPAIRIGNTITLHPRKLAHNGDLCLFFNQEQATYTIGEWIDDMGNNYHIKQYTPQKTKNLPKTSWVKHSIIVANFF
ncbi:Transcriptional regulator [Commensalibacter communis]|uniref:helix-turn-helix transcriptional regulator n=1 Tax=Commensalibacter communis TaxID=2972786 RepID=UPI0022FF5921|nr:helix-turn-helix transcriptional regulator [Commensalibacter communis]CAI3953742.1 Transcriptional regulator [Commensalibacter communis]CAI3959077.1 Transcriptional regulator [Commensalibacter communis]